MADIRDVQSDLSTGSPNTGNTVPVVPLAATLQTTRPVDAVQRAQVQDRTIGTLQYPADLPNYYMKFDITNYARQDLFSVAQTTTLMSLVLPLASKLVDTQQVQYTQKPVGAWPGAVLNAGMAPVTAAVANAFNGNAQGALDSATSIFNQKTGTALLGAAGVSAVNSLDAAVPGAGAAVQAATGYAPNYFLTVLLDGPQYKTHNLSWQFSPRNPKEAESLNQIIRAFNNAMAPQMAFSGAVFTFPKVFRISYSPNPRYLYKFKPAVLTSFTVDYSGGGMPAFYRTASETHNQTTPKVLTVQAQFLELEFWLYSDFGSDPAGSDGLPDNVQSTTGGQRNV